MGSPRLEVSTETEAIAVVLGEGANAFDAVKSLTRCGIPVTVVSHHFSAKRWYGGAAVLQCRDPNEDGSALAKFLNRSVHPGRVVVLVTTSDAFAVWLGRYGQELDPRFRFLSTSGHAVEALHDKILFHELCRRVGVACPRTLVLAGPEDLFRHADDVPFPCIAKPRHSKDWTPALGYKVQRLTSLPELRAFATLVWNAGATVVVQDEIPGGPEQIYFVGGLYNERSRPEAVFIGQKLLQYPLDVGSTSLARLRWHPTVSEACDRFAARVGLSGLVDVEFKYDVRDGLFKIIEVNPRNGLWHRIGDDGRYNITAYYFYRLTGQAHRTRGYCPHVDDRRWVFLSGYLCSAVESWGLLRGTAAFCRELVSSRLRCGSDLIDLRWTFAQLRVVIGHIRRLPITTLLFGRTGPSADDMDPRRPLAVCTPRKGAAVVAGR